MLAQTVLQPLSAQLSNIYGRRWPMLTSIVVFALGSGIGGGATNVAMLIAGRTVQGLGSGGIFMLVDLIVCDLVSQRERGKYLGITLSTASLGSILGPVVGGALATRNWRWVFWINLPISAVVLAVLAAFLRLRRAPLKNKREGLRQIDYAGSALFVASMTSLLIGLIEGGVVHPWSSSKIILPIVLGAVGWAAFHTYEGSRWCTQPSVPPVLFSRRNAAIGFFLSFMAASFLRWIVFFLPVYFQGVRALSPLTSGVNILPTNAFLIPAAMVAGSLMSKLGLYRPLHFTGFALVALGAGLLSLLDRTSPTVMWTFWQIFIAIGLGLLIPTILPAIQADLPSSETASATGLYAFLRSFGFVWGVTIPSVIFDSQVDHWSSLITDAGLREQLRGGRAYGFASTVYRSRLSAEDRNQLASVYIKSLNAVWWAAVGFSGIGILAALLQKHVELKKKEEGEFGLEIKNEKRRDAAETSLNVEGEKMGSPKATPSMV